MNLLTNLSVFPRSIKVEFSSSLEFLFGFYRRVEDPFSIGKRDIRFHGFGSLTEGFEFLVCEFSVQDLKVVAE